MSKEAGILETLSQIADISKNNKLDDNEKLHALLESLCSLIEVEKASIMLKKGNTHLEVVASTRPELVGIKQDLNSESPSCWVIKNKKPLYMDGNTKEKTLSHKNKYKTDSFFLTPIFRDKKAIGVLSMTDKKNEKLFSQKDRTIILQLVGVIISAIENQGFTKQLKEKESQLRKKNKQLKEYEKIRQDFFSLLVHDLKSPIAEVVANLDVLSYTTNEENLFFVEAAQASCERMFHMVSNLLDITRLENKMLKLIPERLEASDLIEEALSLMHGQAKIKNIKMQKVEGEERENLFFTGDRGLLLRVFQNLLSNAINYSPENSEIEIGYKTINSKILFYVDDTGPGIEDEDKEIIFDKYVQISASKGGKKHHSSGLGLNFCKLIIKAHKGKIFVKDRKEGGSSFRFVLSRIIPENITKTP